MNQRSSRAFSLVEIMVATAVSCVLILLLLSATGQVTTTVGAVTGKMDAFQSAQAGFDIMTQKLADATLNTYYDYAKSASGVPSAYIRRSDLHFYIAQNADLKSISSANANSGQSIYFQAPLGYSKTGGVYGNTPGLLNACGYFVEFGPDAPYRPAIFDNGTGSNVKSHYRYRLMQVIQPTEDNGIYADQEGATAEIPPWSDNPSPWIAPLMNNRSESTTPALPIAENVIALIILNPSIDTASTVVTSNTCLISADYRYNSRQGIPPPILSPDLSASRRVLALQAGQIPPVLQITMVAIDSASAVRLDDGTGTPPAAIENALRDRFADATQYASDLNALETALTASRVHYQILSTSVRLRESKWSDQ